MKNTLLFIFLFALINSQLFAQNNFVKGTLITNNNDTLHGLINYSNSGRNPLIIEFQKSGDSESIKYKPLQIKLFYVDEEIYVSRIVNVDISPNNLDDLTYNKNPVIKRDTVFLSASILGKPSLYYLKDRFGKEHFFIENDSIVELIHNKYLITNTDISVGTTGYYIGESDKYKQQLIINMGDCTGISATISDLKYEHTEFIKLFRKYYECKNSKPSFIQKKEETLLEPIAIAGGSMINTFLQAPTPSYYYGNIKLKPSYNITLGIALNLVLSRNRRSWSFYNEFAYLRNKTTGSIDSSTSTSELNKRFDIDLTYIKLASMIRYQYPGEKIKPFINVGMINSYLLKYYDKEIITNTIPYSSNTYQIDMIDGILKYENGYAVETGVSFKRLSAEFRYEKTRGFAPNSIVKVPSRSYFLLLGYKF